MSLRQETYLAIIEEALAEAGRDALILSALDVQAILDWQRDGVPLGVALKGVRQGAHVFERTSRPGAAFPRRVSFFTPWVNKLQKRYRDRVFTASAPAPATSGSAEASETSGELAGSEGAQLEAAERCFDGLRRQLDDGRARCPGFASVYAKLLTELEARRASLSPTPKGESMDEDRVLHWAIEIGQGLVEEARASLTAEERAALDRSADANARDRFPMASASALATKRRLEGRKLLQERHGLVLVDMRELTR